MLFKFIFTYFNFIQFYFIYFIIIIIILNNFILIILCNFNFRKTFFKLPMTIPTASIRQYILDGWKKKLQHMPLSLTELL